MRSSDYDHLHEVLAEELHVDGKVRFADAERLLSSKPWTAYLKIAEGCSNHCTYCAIPLIRGDNVSVPMERLVEEARGLAKRGVKELVLKAQDTTNYGVYLYGAESCWICCSVFMRSMVSTGYASSISIQMRSMMS